MSQKGDCPSCGLDAERHPWSECHYETPGDVRAAMGGGAVPAPADPLLAVLEAAGRAAWTQEDEVMVYDADGIIVADTADNPGQNRADMAAAIVRAVNSFAGAREALRAVIGALDAALGFVHMTESCTQDEPCNGCVAFEQARAALATMEGRDEDASVSRPEPAGAPRADDLGPVGPLCGTHGWQDGRAWHHDFDLNRKVWTPERRPMR